MMVLRAGAEEHAVFMADGFTTRQGLRLYSWF